MLVPENMSGIRIVIVIVRILITSYVRAWYVHCTAHVNCCALVQFHYTLSVHNGAPTLNYMLGHLLWWEL